MVNNKIEFTEKSSYGLEERLFSDILSQEELETLFLDMIYYNNHINSQKGGYCKFYLVQFVTVTSKYPGCSKELKSVQTNLRHRLSPLISSDNANLS